MATCLSCARTFGDDRESCPTCLASLVVDPAATVSCPQCGRECPGRMHTCPGCLALLRPDPAAQAEFAAEALIGGRRLHRPAWLPAFRDGPGCSVVRLTGRGPLVVAGPDGFIEADVSSPANAARPPVRVRDVAGPVLFDLRVYAAAVRALVAIAPDGAPVATLLRPAMLEERLDIRDETSAPVARLAPGPGGFDVIETGGRVLGTVSRVDVELDGWVDDHWTLIGTAEQWPLSTLGAVALLLAAKVLLGRPTPEEPSRASDRVAAALAAAEQDVSGTIMGRLLDRWS